MTGLDQRFLTDLHALTRQADIIVYPTGRPLTPIADITFIITVVAHLGLSTRDVVPVLRDLNADGWTTMAPGFNTVSNWRRDEGAIDALCDLSIKVCPHRVLEDCPVVGFNPGQSRSREGRQSEFFATHIAYHLTGEASLPGRPSRRGL